MDQLIHKWETFKEKKKDEKNKEEREISLMLVSELFVSYKENIYALFIGRFQKIWFQLLKRIIKLSCKRQQHASMKKHE